MSEGPQILSLIFVYYLETGQDDAKKGADMEKLEREEEIDIDLDDPSTKDAATKIQAAFRGQQSRRGIKQKKTENEAATKIQAGFRGHQARKSVKEMKSKESLEGAVEERQQPGDEGKGEEEEEYVENVTENDVQEDNVKKYDDEKYGEAAVKIQAGFRGYKTREDLKSKSQENTQQETETGVEENDEMKEEEAAVKIQASFRGHKARKEVDAMKSSQSIAGDANDEGQGNIIDNCKIRFNWFIACKKAQFSRLFCKVKSLHLQEGKCR